MLRYFAPYIAIAALLGGLLGAAYATGVISVPALYGGLALVTAIGLIPAEKWGSRGAPR